MRSRPLHLLAQLRRAERDRLRQDLQTVVEAELACEAAQDALESSRREELAAAWRADGAPMPLGGYLRRAESEAVRLAAERAELLARTTTLRHDLEEAHAGLRSLERAIERLAEREAAAATAAAERALDETAIVRHAVGLRTPAPA